MKQTVIKTALRGGGTMVKGSSDALFTLMEKAVAAGQYVEYQGDGLGGGVLYLRDAPRTERPVCGTQTRQGEPCRARAVSGGHRCRMHGGLSTGPKTEAGRAAIAESNRRRRQKADELMAEIHQMQQQLADRKVAPRKTSARKGNEVAPSADN